MKSSVCLPPFRKKHMNSCGVWPSFRKPYACIWWLTPLKEKNTLNPVVVCPPSKKRWWTPMVVCPPSTKSCEFLVRLALLQKNRWSHTCIGPHSETHMNSYGVCPSFRNIIWVPMVGCHPLQEQMNSYGWWSPIRKRVSRPMVVCPPLEKQTMTSYGGWHSFIKAHMASCGWWPSFRTIMWNPMVVGPRSGTYMNYYSRWPSFR